MLQDQYHMNINEVSDFKKDELRHELRNEPPNNFQIYINGNPWKVFKGKGRNADDRAEQQHYNQLKRWASEKSASTGKKWEVSITGKPASESVELDEAGIPQKPKPYGRGNPVAKNMEKFNKPKTHADKKKEMKKRGPKISMDEAPLVVRGENNLQTMVDRALDVWLGGEKRSREELEKVLNAIGKTIQGNGERLVIDTIGEATDADNKRLGITPRNPSTTYTLRGKHKVTLTKSGDSMKPSWHCSVDGKDCGTHAGEKAAMKSAIKHIDSLAEGAVKQGIATLGVLAALMGAGEMMSADNTPLGKAMAVAAANGDEYAAKHLDNLDFYADENSAMIMKLSNKLAYLK